MEDTLDEPKEPAKEHDPLRKEYSTLQNMGFIMKGTFRYQKALLFFFPLAILMSVVNSYLPTFALSAIIDRVTAECNPAELLMTVAAFFGALLLVMALQTFADANIGWRMYYARIKIMMWRIHKVLCMDYEHLESARVMEACQRARRATAGETNGVEGMMRSFQSLMVTLVSVATAVTIVWQLSPWMVLLMVLLGTARENVTLTESHAKAEDVRQNEDKLLEAFGSRATVTMEAEEARPDALFDRVVEQSGLTDTISQLKYGADTFIKQSFDEEGTALSGGQQQKLAIARALYKDAPIVILDEPTAALDPIAEYEIYRQFSTLVDGKTAIYISHRLSSCQFCDVIYVFANGRIQETGTHNELVKLHHGFYAKLFEAQAQYYRS